MLGDGKYIGKGRIKEGAIVGQDHGFHKWTDNGEVFDVFEFIGTRVICRAFGYGILHTPGGYGNGCLFVKQEDIVLEKPGDAYKGTSIGWGQPLPNKGGLSMTMHELKTWPSFYNKLLDGSKTFEVRKNDRDFHEGDVLLLREFESIRREYTGRSMTVDVTYIFMGEGCEDGYVVMSIKHR